MWGGISQLDLPYEVRHMMRFKDKYQRPLTDREKEIIEKVGFVELQKKYCRPQV